jgi:membrane protein YqaA with SNARE-associated domain
LCAFTGAIFSWNRAALFYRFPRTETKRPGDSRTDPSRNTLEIGASCMRKWISASKEILPFQIVAFLAPASVRSVSGWIYQLGGLGFIPLGLLDNSVIPVPGSMDLLIIFLCARRAELWAYYALMATVGSVLGGYASYRLARKGGKETLVRKIPSHVMEKVYQILRRWGFGAIAIPALLPPPVPMVPFLLVAGAAQYPIRKFLFALTLGRMTRYALLAFVAARHGRQVIDFLLQLPQPVLWAILGLTVVALAAVLFFLRAKRQKAA